MVTALSRAAPAVKRRKVTIRDITRLYETKTPVTVVTAHDYPSGTYIEQNDVDICLVGDSLAMVACGYDSTSHLPLEEYIYHCAAVSRGSKTALRVGDLPFGTFEQSSAQAIETAVRVIREGGMEAIKLEGGVEHFSTIRRLVSVGIPVMGHVGLTPQRHAALSGYRVQGKTADSAHEILSHARAVQAAGAFAIVLEALPAKLGGYITSQLSIPTIGIGAGAGCSGQVLVQLDLLGAYDRHTPKFVKRFAQIGLNSVQGIRDYCDEVRSNTFPAEQHTYPVDDREYALFRDAESDSDVPEFDSAGRLIAGSSQSGPSPEEVERRSKELLKALESQPWAVKS